MQKVRTPSPFSMIQLPRERSCSSSSQDMILNSIFSPKAINHKKLTHINPTHADKAWELYNNIAQQELSYFKKQFKSHTDKSIFKYIDSTSGNSFLHFAVLCNKIEILEFFLEIKNEDGTSVFHKQDILNLNADGLSSLDIALRNKNTKIIKLLLWHIDAPFDVLSIDNEVCMPAYTLICAIGELVLSYSTAESDDENIENKTFYIQLINQFLNNYGEGFFSRSVFIEHYIKQVPISFANLYKFHKIEKFLLESEKVLQEDFPWSLFSAIDNYHCEAISKFVSRPIGNLNIKYKDEDIYLIHAAARNLKKEELENSIHLENAKSVFKSLLLCPLVDHFMMEEEEESKSILNDCLISKELREEVEDFFDANYKMKAEDFLNFVGVTLHEMNSQVGVGEFDHDLVLAAQPFLEDKIRLKIVSEFFKKIPFNNIKIKYVTRAYLNLDSPLLNLENDTELIVLVRITEENICLDLYKYSNFLSDIKMGVPVCAAGRRISSVFDTADPNLLTKSYALNKNLICE